MYLPIKLTDWSMDDYKLSLQIVGVFLIVIMLVYIALSSRDED